MRLGVLLGGCGHYDGSDVQESVLVLLAIEEAGERALLLAPDVGQGRTINHLTAGACETESRQVLLESARLSRRAVQSLVDARPDDLEALIIPGGYGPAINFSTGFAEKGVVRRVVPQVEVFLRHFLVERKPIGMVGLGEMAVRMILDQEIAAPALPSRPSDVLIDREHSLVHTPGFAVFQRVLEVKEGISAMVAEVLRMMEQRLAEARVTPGGGAGP